MAQDVETQEPPADFDVEAAVQQLGGTWNGGGEQSMEQRAAAAKAAMVGMPPTIPLPSDGMVRLSRGLLFEDEWQRVALMREVTGEDEEVLARFDLSKIGSAWLYWDALLTRTVVSIGSINFEEIPLSACREKLRSLLLGDRESLYLALVRATWGPIRTFEEVACPLCGEKSDQNVVLEDTAEHKTDFPATELEEPERIWYDYKLRKGQTLSLRLPTGDDILKMQLDWKQEPSAAERNTIMIGRLVNEIDGNAISSGASYAKKLGAPDRQDIIRFIMDMQPGPRLGGVETSCAHCEQKFWLELGLARLLQLTA